MAIAHFLELLPQQSSSPALVQAAGYLAPLGTPVRAKRGRVDLAVQVLSNKDRLTLPSGSVPRYGLKLASDLKGPWLALSEPLNPSNAAGAVGLYVGAIELDTPEMRAAMHAELSDPIPELAELPVVGEIYWTPTGAADATRSQTYGFTVLAPLSTDETGLPGSPNAPYPPAGELVSLDAATGRLDVPAGGISLADPAFGGRLEAARLPVASPRSVAIESALEVDTRIAGKTAAANAALFSTVNHATSTYVRNPASFLAGVDLSGVSVWCSAGDVRMTATALSPRHVWLNDHFYPGNGATFGWLDRNGVFVTRVLANSQKIGTSDVRIGYLGADLPASVSFLGTVSDEAAWRSMSGVPMVYLVGDGSARVANTNALAGGGFSFVIPPATQAQRQAFFQSLGDGDSSHPAIYLLGSRPVFIGGIHFANGPTGGSGESVTGNNPAAINAAMAALGGGYQLSFATPPVALANSASISASVAPGPGQIPIAGSDGYLPSSRFALVASRTYGLLNGDNTPDTQEPVLYADGNIDDGTPKVLHLANGYAVKTGAGIALVDASGHLAGVAQFRPEITDSGQLIAVPTANGAVADGTLISFFDNDNENTFYVYVFRFDSVLPTSLPRVVKANDNGGAWFMVSNSDPFGDSYGFGSVLTRGGDVYTEGGGLNTAGGSLNLRGGAVDGFVPSATGNTSLNLGSNYRFTGAGVATFTLATVGPTGGNALRIGAQQRIYNAGTAVLTIAKFGGTTLTTLQPGEMVTVTAVAAGSPPIYDFRKSGVDTASAAHVHPYILVREQQPSGTDAGAVASQGFYLPRTLNTLVTDGGTGATLTSNQITLPAGTYRCQIACPALGVERHKARLRNITAGSTLLVGSNAYSSGTNGMTSSIISGRFTLAASTVVEVQQGFQVTSANSFARGPALGSFLPGEVEVYAVAEFWRE